MNMRKFRGDVLGSDLCWGSGRVRVADVGVDLGTFLAHFWFLSFNGSFVWYVLVGISISLLGVVFLRVDRRHWSGIFRFHLSL